MMGNESRQPSPGQTSPGMLPAAGLRRRPRPLHADVMLSPPLIGPPGTEGCTNSCVDSAFPHWETVEGHSVIKSNPGQ